MPAAFQVGVASIQHTRWWLTRFRSSTARGRHGACFDRSGMGRPLRYVPPGALVEVTCRTIQERLLLRPSPKVNDVVLGIMGRAQKLFPVRIHAFVVMGNHAHWLLSVNDAAQLAGFMGFVCSNIAREVGRLNDWPHRFWSRRYRSIVVADVTAAVSRLRYILLNGCKEGFVDRPKHWPGLSCAQALTRGDRLTGTWHDRTAEFHARRRGECVSRTQFLCRYSVELSPLPCWAELSASEYRRACAEIVADVEAETRRQRADSGKRCLGRRRVLAQHPHDRPVVSRRSPAPLVHASSREVKEAFIRSYRAFVDAFRTAAECLRKGLTASFPLGAFPPRLPFVSESASVAS